MPIIRMPILLSVVSVMISKHVYNMTIDCVCQVFMCFKVTGVQPLRGKPACAKRAAYPD
jgi:hypothetical protein